MIFVKILSCSRVPLNSITLESANKWKAWSGYAAKSLGRPWSLAITFRSFYRIASSQELSKSQSRSRRRPQNITGYRPPRRNALATPSIPLRRRRFRRQNDESGKSPHRETSLQLLPPKSTSPLPLPLPSPTNISPSPILPTTIPFPSPNP